MLAKICNLEAKSIVLINKDKEIEISEEDSSKNVTSDDQVSGHSGKTIAVTHKSILEFSLGRIINSSK